MTSLLQFFRAEDARVWLASGNGLLVVVHDVHMFALQLRLESEIVKLFVIMIFHVISKNMTIKIINLKTKCNMHASGSLGEKTSLWCLPSGVVESVSKGIGN